MDLVRCGEEQRQVRAIGGPLEGADATAAHQIRPRETICHRFRVPSRLLSESQSLCLGQTADKEDPGAQGISQEGH